MKLKKCEVYIYSGGVIYIDQTIYFPLKDKIINDLFHRNIIGAKINELSDELNNIYKDDKLKINVWERGIIFENEA